MEQRQRAPPVPVSMAYGLVDIRSFTSGIKCLGQQDGIINGVLDTWPEVCNLMEFVMLLYRDSRSMLMQCIWQIGMAIDKQLSVEVDAVGTLVFPTLWARKNTLTGRRCVVLGSL